MSNHGTKWGVSGSGPAIRNPCEDPLKPGDYCIYYIFLGRGKYGRIAGLDYAVDPATLVLRP